LFIKVTNLGNKKTLISKYFQLIYG